MAELQPSKLATRVQSSSPALIAPALGRTLLPLREPWTVHWLVVSLVISVVLTVAVNIALRAFPGLGDRIARSLTRLDSRTSNPDRGSERRTRVFVPWKAMIIASVI